eukprot:scaffold10.g2476.t1
MRTRRGAATAAADPLLAAILARYAAALRAADPTTVAGWRGPCAATLLHIAALTNADAVTVSALVAAGCPLDAWPSTGVLSDLNSLLQAAHRKPAVTRVGRWPALFLPAMQDHGATVRALLAAGASLIQMVAGTSVFHELLDHDRAKDTAAMLRLLLAHRPGSAATFEAAVWQAPKWAICEPTAALVADHFAERCVSGAFQPKAPQALNLLRFAARSNSVDAFDGFLAVAPPDADDAACTAREAEVFQQIFKSGCLDLLDGCDADFGGRLLSQHAGVVPGQPAGPSAAGRLEVA